MTKWAKFQTEKNVNDHDKAKLYSDVLQKYLTAKEQITPTGIISPVVTQTTTLSMYRTNQFWKLFLKKYKTRVENMLRFLRQSGKHIGKTTAESRIKIGKSRTDVINDQMSSRKTFNPREWLPFTEALKNMNVPHDLIGNPRRLNITIGSTGGKNGRRLHHTHRKILEV